MRVQLRWFVLPAALGLFAAATHAGDCSTLSGCALKQCEIENLIDAARKEGSMRRLATLNDMRAEAMRCDDKKKDEPKKADAAK